MHQKYDPNLITDDATDIDNALFEKRMRIHRFRQQFSAKREPNINLQPGEIGVDMGTVKEDIDIDIEL
jgi:hypothetical protein